MRMKSADIGRQTKAEEDRKAELSKLLTAIESLEKRLGSLEEESKGLKKELKELREKQPVAYHVEHKRDARGFLVSSDIRPLKKLN